MIDSSPPFALTQISVASKVNTLLMIKCAVKSMKKSKNQLAR